MKFLSLIYTEKSALMLIYQFSFQKKIRLIVRINIDVLAH